MLEVTGLGHRYGSDPHATTSIADVSFAVGAGEIVCLVGPSGCGKSTLLRVVAGLLAPGRGEVTLHGAPVRGVPPDLAVVFQDYGRSLFGWLSVRGNVEFPLRAGFEKAARRARAAEALAQVGLEGQERRYPAQLSGGMQQRVSIARALAYRPALLLMDEPFASLDAIVRARITQDLLDLAERDGLSVVLVTHDLEEALSVSDVVHVLSQGPRARIVSSRAVPISRPRSILGARSHPAFGGLVRQLWRDLSGEAPLERVA